MFFNAHEYLHMHTLSWQSTFQQICLDWNVYLFPKFQMDRLKNEEYTI